eukprot:m.64811 g.64811  ORF g.64811 m.64811 type:complete len:499 (+) comp8248_c0_seq1:290-1786(+)
MSDGITDVDRKFNDMQVSGGNELYHPWLIPKKERPKGYDWAQDLWDNYVDRADSPTRIKDLYSMVEGILVSGQGALLQVKNKSDGSPWVLKVFNPFDDKVRFKRGAAREYKALNALNEKWSGSGKFPVVMESNVKTYDSALSVNPDNPGYVVMSFIDGVNLMTWRKTNQPSILQTCKMIRQLLVLVDMCHKAGVVHRDIKPDNIMISGDNMFLIDFGAAFVAKDPDYEEDVVEIGVKETGLEENFGGINWLAKNHTLNQENKNDNLTHEEQKAFRENRRACHNDTFHCAALAYWLNKGGDTGWTTKGGTPHPCTYAPLAELILTGINASPKKRYSTAEDMLTALAAVMAGLPEHEPKPDLNLKALAAKLKSVPARAGSISKRKTLPGTFRSELTKAFAGCRTFKWDNLVNTGMDSTGLTMESKVEFAEANDTVEFFIGQLSVKDTEDQNRNQTLISLAVQFKDKGPKVGVQHWQTLDEVSITATMLENALFSILETAA